MSAPSRLAPRVCRFCRTSPTSRRAFSSSSAAKTTTTTTLTTTLPPTDRTPKPDWPQRQPRGEYYDILLRDPTPYHTTTITTTTKASEPLGSSPAAPSPPPPPAKTYDTISSRTAYSNSNDDTATTAAERARVIFGSRLLGPAERADRAAGRAAQATTIAGVRVPPRPEEPDNCCMSGCVNCVWDLFREDMEEWTLASSEARKRLAESAAATAAAAAAAAASAGLGSAGGEGGGVGGAGPETRSTAVAASLDADGASSRSNRAVGDATIAKDMWTDDAFRNVPVGIREFMKQEKRLKEKHRREGTAGG